MLILPIQLTVPKRQQKVEITTIYAMMKIILIGSPRGKQTIIVDRIKLAGIMNRKSGILIISSSTYLGGP